MTLNQLGALHELHAQAREHYDLLAGMLASVVVNFSTYAPKKPTKPTDFVAIRAAKRAVYSVQAEPTQASVFEDCNRWRALGRIAPLYCVRPEILNAE